MAILSRWTALPALMALAGCGIVGPIYDPGLRGAPRMACAEVAPVADAAQCFRFERRRIGGERLEMNDGGLDGETELLAFLTGGPGCAGGDLHYATVTGEASEPGRLSVLAFTGTGALNGRDYEWREPFAVRTFRLSGAGGPFVNATGIRVRAPAGGFRVARVCLADYWREDILPLRASRRQP
ncbi:hypothetical protein [Sphingosinicella sp.]|uniref:hypothetical protein n=1 Tax=Sphingosinicella sp. TaxID=1917971 RepID=UPI004037D7BC